MEESQNGSLQMLKKIQNYVFNLKQKVGQGSFSQVFRGTNINNNTTVAVKKIRVGDVKSKIARRLLECQITILRELNHPNIIKCLDIHFSVHNCYIITEFCQGGNLDSLIKHIHHLSERDFKKIILSVLQALQYLSHLGIVHRDLKLSNIFVKQGIFKIGDFGFAIKGTTCFKDVTIGSPIYMSPEGLIHNIYGPKTDVWAFGLLIYQLLHGTIPLQNCRSQQQLRKKVLEPPIISNNIPVQLKELILGCLRINEKERMSVTEIAKSNYIIKIKQQLNHEFLTEKEETITDNTSTEKSYSEKSAYHISDISYQGAISIINFCRFTHKIGQLNKSPIFAKCLIWLTRILARAHVVAPQNLLKQTKIQETIKEFNQNYINEYGYDYSQQFRLEDLLYECDRRAQKQPKLAIQYKALVKQTELLIKSLEQKTIQYFSKKTKCKQYANTLIPRQ